MFLLDMIQNCSILFSKDHLKHPIGQPNEALEIQTCTVFPCISATVQMLYIPIKLYDFIDEFEWKHCTINIAARTAYIDSLEKAINLK